MGSLAAHSPPCCTIDGLPRLGAIALFALDIFIIWGLVQYTADMHGDAL